MQVIDFWAVEVIDDCEGKTSKDLAYFSSQLAAEAFSKGVNYYGDDGIVRPCQVVMFDSAEEAHEHNSR